VQDKREKKMQNLVSFSFLADTVRPTDVTALAGTVIGVAALVLGVTNFLRDRPKVIVNLLWDWAVANDPKYDSAKPWGVVGVSNVGRRPVFIMSASLQLPKGYEYTHELLMESIQGQRLAEGDPPARFMVTQEGMDKYAKDWRKIRAVVKDSARKEYASRRPKRSERPSWGAN
jgi:hypothetical protein